MCFYACLLLSLFCLLNVCVGVATLQFTNTLQKYCVSVLYIALCLRKLCAMEIGQKPEAVKYHHLSLCVGVRWQKINGNIQVYSYSITMNTMRRPENNLEQSR